MQFQKRYYYLALLIVSLITSCTTSKNPLFSKHSPHEKYGDALKNAGLEHSQLGNEWFAAADKALEQPVAVSLPYKETGYFSAEKPSAAGYLLAAKRGENILVNLSTIPAEDFLFFTELWRTEASAEPSYLTTIDTLTHQLKYTVKKEGNYIVRLQPELLRSVEYTISITTGPSLAFPVDSSGNPKIISYWGAGRDGGSRRHEGVDIAAKFRTPALAAIGGYIGRVNQNNLGGKVVFLLDQQTGNSLYYAHLDSQIAKPGQKVSAGEIVGLVGKTGNARNTVPHLHFGIYTNNGAIDPLPFIDNRHSPPTPVTASTEPLNKWVRTTGATTLHGQPSVKSTTAGKLARGDVVFILAASGDWYKVQSAENSIGFVGSNRITSKIMRSQKSNEDLRLFDLPDTSAPVITIISKNETFDVTGSYNNFYLAEYKNRQGWVLK